MTLSKNDEIFWVQSIASDMQNCAYNLAQDSISEAEVFIAHARSNLVRVKQTHLNDQIQVYLNHTLECKSSIERIRLADKLCTLADILLLQSI